MLKNGYKPRAFVRDFTVYEYQVQPLNRPTGKYLDSHWIGDGEIQFLIGIATVTVFIQKFNHGMTIIFEKIKYNQ